MDTNTKLKQIGGDHYENMNISPSELCALCQIEFNHGNIIKYLARWRRKNGLEDLRKARQYIDLILMWAQKFKQVPTPQTYTEGMEADLILINFYSQLPEREATIIKLILTPDGRHYEARYHEAKNILDSIIQITSST